MSEPDFLRKPSRSGWRKSVVSALLPCRSPASDFSRVHLESLVHNFTAPTGEPVIPRYTRPEMTRIWSDENRFRTWLAVEVAATETLAEAGLVPKDAARAIR